MAPVSRDIYKHDVDFTTLALQYPEFAKKLKPNRQLDFSDPESVRQLTKSLLHRDFRLSIDLPEDRLCPPVPNRLNYIFWLQDLLACTSDNFKDFHDPDRQVLGVDIGTGASCIYPLLASRQNPTWRFLVTEIDPKSRGYASHNIEANGMQSHIRLLPLDVDAKSILPVQQLQPFPNIDFIMTNPPFYASEDEMLQLAEKKQRPPNSACTGAPVEMITQGGEVQFVSQLIIESTLPQNRDRIQWFTSMLGKLSSVGTVVERLRETSCTNYAVTEFIQGQKTRRWAVAWSWQGLRPTVDIARGIPGFEKRLLPFPSEFDFRMRPGPNDSAVDARIDQQLKTLDLRWQWRSALATGMGMAKRDVWSRKARRRKKKEDGQQDMDDGEDESEENEEAAIVFKVTLKHEQDGVVLVTIRWMQGQDAVLFESFCGWLKRRIEAQ